jgi:hypothetical protein
MKRVVLVVLVVIVLANVAIAAETKSGIPSKAELEAAWQAGFTAGQSCHEILDLTLTMLRTAKSPEEKLYWECIRNSIFDGVNHRTNLRGQPWPRNPK